MPQRFITSFASLLFPYALVILNIYLGHNVTLTAFVVQSAMMRFTTSMVAFSLQATVFPLASGTVKDVSTFIQAEALPQLFGSALGIVVAVLACSFLLTQHIITTGDLPMLAIGVLSSAIPLGRSLYQARTT